jgi:hypothetical protein
VQTSNISELQALCFFSFVHSPSVLCKSAVNKGITPYLGPSLLATLVPSATVSSANMGMRKSALLLFSFFFYSCWTIKRDMNSQLSSVCVCVCVRARARTRTGERTQGLIHDKQLLSLGYASSPSLLSSYLFSSFFCERHIV